jgi:hypothetical protein
VAKEEADYGADLDVPNPNGPILGIRDLAVLLRTGSVAAARKFAREHLRAARLDVFGVHWKFDRAKVLEIILALPKQSGSEPKTI